MAAPALTRRVGQRARRARRQFPIAGYDGPPKLRATIRVPNDMQGRLWRITIPGLSRGFTLDPKTPHIFATSPDRFFMPETKQ